MLPNHKSYLPTEQIILDDFAERCSKDTGQTELFHTLLQSKLPAKTIIEQLTGGTNTLLYDNAELPSVMVKVPCFSLDQVIPMAKKHVHPMFLTPNGPAEYIWISKYQNITDKGRAYSLPNQCPRNFISYKEALEYCQAKGPGWHLMTNYQWAGIALLCQSHGIIPRGNNYKGSDFFHPEDTCRLIPALMDKTGGPALTGSGPAAWSHNHTVNGIFDCNGNVAEWVSGLRMLDGKLLWLIPEYSADPNAQKQDSSFWRAILPDGRFVPTDTPGTLHFDYTCPPPPAGGTSSFALTRSRSYPQYQYEKPVLDMDTTYGHTPFSNFSSATGLSAQALLFLQSSCVFPLEDSCVPGDLYFRNHGEMAALRGGHWYHGKSAGMFWLNLAHKPEYIAKRIGFRCAWIPPEHLSI